jgi:hypothetical protein
MTTPKTSPRSCAARPVGWPTRRSPSCSSTPTRAGADRRRSSVLSHLANPDGSHRLRPALHPGRRRPRHRASHRQLAAIKQPVDRTSPRRPSRDRSSNHRHPRRRQAAGARLLLWVCGQPKRRSTAAVPLRRRASSVAIPRAPGGPGVRGLECGARRNQERSFRRHRSARGSTIRPATRWRVPRAGLRRVGCDRGQEGQVPDPYRDGGRIDGWSGVVRLCPRGAWPTNVDRGQRRFATRSGYGANGLPARGEAELVGLGGRVDPASAA